MAFRKIDLDTKQVKSAFKQNGKNYSKTAAALKVSISTVKRYLNPPKK